MRVMVCTGKLINHIEILHKEQKEAQLLLDNIENWRNLLFAVGIYDAEDLEKHLRIVQNQLENIRRRIVLLEDMVEKFSRLSDEALELVESACAAVDPSHMTALT